MTVSTVAPLRSTIPARLDRLGWSPFHTRMVAGLGALILGPLFDAVGRKPVIAGTYLLPLTSVAAGKTEPDPALEARSASHR
jgi:hypothetical protein